MPGKTHGELILELSESKATLTERVDNLRAEVEKVEEKVSAVDNLVTDLDKKVTLHQQYFLELRQERKEVMRRAWMIVGPVVGAIIGALLAFFLGK